MATKTETILTDDLDTAFPDDAPETCTDVQTVTFAVLGDAYEIDLSAENREHLRDVLEDWIVAARPAPRITSRMAKSTTPRTPRPSERTGDARTIREWARAQGIPVPTRGRVPKDVVNRWHDAAHNADHNA